MHVISQHLVVATRYEVCCSYLIAVTCGWRPLTQQNPNVAELVVRVDLPGGPLEIEWREADNRVYMTGPAELVFSGTVTV